jgi:hypothetical protein
MKATWTPWLVCAGFSILSLGAACAWMPKPKSVCVELAQAGQDAGAAPNAPLLAARASDGGSKDASLE